MFRYALLWFCFVLALGASPDAAAGRILFIRGGTGTVGFLESFGDDQAASIHDFSTSGGNHGWGTLATVLESDGHVLTQMQEGPSSNNTPITFDQMDLSQYDAIVLGSNNAEYTELQIDAIESFVRSGGGLLVISDANFGLSWQDASNSDQQFLDRFGLIMNQDHGTYQVRRAAGDYIVSDHPILVGVDSFKGEGVTPITLAPNPPSGVSTQVIARVPNGQDFRVNPGDSKGGLVDPAANDGTLVVALAGQGRVVCHFDRNTFFNQNGAGSDIHEHDNERYARNLFNWLTENSDFVDPTPRGIQAIFDEDEYRLKLKFEIPQNVSTDYVYEIRATSDLLDEGVVIATGSGGNLWTGDAEISETDLGDGYVCIEITDTVVLSGSNPRFLELTMQDDQ